MAKPKDNETGEDPPESGEGAEVLILPTYFVANGSRQGVLVIHDHPVPGGLEPVTDCKFDLLLNGKKLQSCGTKDGFFVNVFLPYGTYRVTLQLGRKAAVETLVRIDGRGECVLRVLASSSFIGFDEPSYHPR